MLPLAKSRAERAFTAMPMAATTIIVMPVTGAGSAKRRMVSTRMAPIATHSRAALAMAARIEELLRP